IIEGAVIGLQDVAEDDLPADHAGELHFRGCQVDVGRRDPEVILDLAADLGERPGIDEHVVHGGRPAVRLDAQVRGGVRLPIETSFSNSCWLSRTRKCRPICETMLTTSTESRPSSSRSFLLSPRSVNFSPMSASMSSMSVRRIISRSAMGHLPGL